MKMCWSAATQHRAVRQTTELTRTLVSTLLMLELPAFVDVFRKAVRLRAETLCTHKSVYAYTSARSRRKRSHLRPCAPCWRVLDLGKILGRCLTFNVLIIFHLDENCPRSTLQAFNSLCCPLAWAKSDEKY